MVGCAPAASAAGAGVVSFPGCPRAETKVVSGGGLAFTGGKFGRAVRRIFETFRVGGEGDGFRFDGLLDDLRIYSAPLSDAQAREIWRRGNEVEFTAHGCYSLAGEPGTLAVSAASPAGLDLAGFRYCIRDKSVRTRRSGSSRATIRTTRRARPTSSSRERGIRGTTTRCGSASPQATSIRTRDVS